MFVCFDLLDLLNNCGYKKIIKEDYPYYIHILYLNTKNLIFKGSVCQVDKR